MALPPAFILTLYLILTVITFISIFTSASYTLYLTVNTGAELYIQFKHFYLINKNLGLLHVAVNSMMNIIHTEFNILMDSVSLILFKFTSNY